MHITCSVLLYILLLGTYFPNKIHIVLSRHLGPHALNYARKMRCTRRFTPGKCTPVEYVRPVWHFSFYMQNCTERLGCPVNTKQNRFRSYYGCMRWCRPLIDEYLHMVRADCSHGSQVHTDDDDIITLKLNQAEHVLQVHGRRRNEVYTVNDDTDWDMFKDYYHNKEITVTVAYTDDEALDTEFEDLT